MASADGHDITENDIAIVGMAARLPGARNIAEYWQNLRDGVESVQRYSEEELLEAGETRENLRNRAYVPAGAPLGDLEMFDAEFFGFSPKEAGILDPQHRHFLEVSWEALENAGHPPEKFEGSIGLFGGVGMGAYFSFNLLSNPELVDSVGLFLLRHTGNDKDFLVTRVSYLLDLKGPSVNVQTACSTSLVAVHMAAQSLLSGECDMALAGGVTIEVPHRRGYVYKEGEVLSPDGHCHAFDHRGQGTVFGSGAGVVVLRRAEDALADNDHIHAIIKGSAINNDGASKVGYLAPSVDGQAAAMAEAYEIAGITADTIDYVECHGTGTYMGDPIEISGLTQAFRKTTDDQQFCRIGSVKTNIGHLDTAAGVASLIKASLALQHRKIPASLNFEAPNPNIDFEHSPFVVNDRLTDWTSRGHPRRAAVNSLGVGGTNAHVVVQEPPPPPRTTPARSRHQLLCLSGRTRKAVDGNAQRLADHLEAHPELDLADVAWTLKVGRREFDQRRVVAVESRDEAIEVLRENDRQRVFTHTKVSDNPSCVFMMPGGGAQYTNMGRDLYEAEPVFRQHVDAGLEALKSRHGIDLRPALFPEPGRVEAAETELSRMTRQLPAIFIISYAMAQLLESWGVKPEALVGHSLGENTAACLAGVFSFEDALGLVTLRGELFERIAGGAVTSVQASPATLKPFLDEIGLDLGGINTPELCIASGPVDRVEALEAKLAEVDIDCRRLNIPVAPHSRMLEPILKDFGAYLRTIRLEKPKIPLLSNLTGDWMTDEQAQDPDYWVRHLRQTIHFAEDMAKLLEKEDRIYLEVGPGRTLSSLARQQPGAPAGIAAISTMRHPDHAVSDQTWFLTTLGRLWACGYQVELERWWADETRRRVELPTYAFQHARYWIEPGRGALAADGGRVLKQPDLDDWFYRPVWSGAPLEEPETSGHRHTWLVFRDPTGIAERLVERLRAAGEDVITVDVGDAYHQADEHTYTLAPERGRESYDSLVHDLVASGKAPDRILHMWLATGEARVRMGSSQFHTHTQYGFYSLLFLLQAIADESLPPPIHLSVLTTGAQTVRGEPMPFFEKALVSGPIKVGPREIPGLTASWVDLEPPTQPTLLQVVPVGKLQRLATRPRHATLDGLAELVEAEVRAEPSNGVFAWRDGQRFQQTYKRARLPEAQRTGLQRGGCYLVTGGLGGLGLTFAEHLAERYQARLVLTGRHALPPREEWEAWLQSHGPDEKTSRRILKVRSLEQLGAEVMTAELDVTDIETLREIIARAEGRFGRIDGVFHAAGVVKDELIQMKSQVSVEDVFGPKVHGTMVLKSAFEGRDLDFMLLFSSTSSIIAPAGQVDYVAANAFLNAFAEAETQAGRRVIAVDWGIWNEVGLAAESIRASLTGEGEAAETRAPVDLPLFDAKIDTDKGETTLSALLSPSTHWLLDQHRTKGGDPVVPGTGYLELAREAVVAFGHRRPFEIRDLFFFRPLHVEETETKEVRALLRGNPDGYELEIRSRRKTRKGEGWELHAQASLLLGDVARARPLDLEAIEARCRAETRTETPEGVASPQAVHLQFGRRWFNLRGTIRGEGEALGRLALPPDVADEVRDFQLHPALVDIGTGFAMHLIEDYDAQNLWVPVSYGTVRVHRPMPASIVSWVRLRNPDAHVTGIATFDVTIAEPNGEVVLEVEGFSVKRLEGRVDFAVTSEPSPAEIELEQSGQRQLSPAEEQLLRNMEQGILPAEGLQAMERILAEPAPRAEVVVSSMPIDGLLRQQEQLAAKTTETSSARFDRPALDSEYVEPRDDVERTIVGFWEELLGVNQVGVADSFFDLGGHSLIAVRLFAKIKQAYSVDYPISVLFEAPTVERCAAMIKEAIGHAGEEAAPAPEGASDDGEPKAKKPGPRYLHLVPMHKGEGGPKRPFFLVAGMFGNVLNLGHLANLIGTDRPFYGLQARGLYGDVEPHETFEEAARDYLAEVRQVQPHGPYLIGGFSGGGITAWEMAQQLVAEGEEVAMLLLLDSVLPQPPELRRADRVKMKMMDLQRNGPTYLLEWGKGRVEWELGKVRKRFFPQDQVAPTSPTSFQNEKIEAAFYRALGRYEMRHYPGRATLFRPKLDPMYVIDDDHWIDDERKYMFHDNGFGKFADDIEVYEMPGDHDSMVLEPNVRVMARRLKRCIERAELEIEYKARNEAPPPRDPRELELARSIRGPRDFTAA